MANLFEMKQERHAEIQAAEAVLARAEKEKRTLTPAEDSLVQEHMAKVQTLNPRIEQIESKNTLLKVLRENPVALLGGGVAEPGERKAQPNGMRRTLRDALKQAAPHERAEVEAFARYIGGDMTALADLTPGGDAGVLIPSTVAGVVERNYAAFAPVVSVCRLWPTDTGELTAFPVVTDEEEAEILAPAALTGADDVVSGDTPPTELTGPLMGAFKFSSKPVFVPRETVTDSTLNVLDEIFNALLSRIIRKQNQKFTKGNGTGEPSGFLKDATAYEAGSVALDLDIALDLCYSVPALYRPNGIYMASDTTIKYLRKLKTGISGDKRSLWKDAFEEGNATLGTPAKLHGYPIYVNNDMDSVASDGTFAAVSPLVFGDFKRFVVRQAERGTPYVYRYTVPAKDGGAVIAFQRSDSKLIVSEAISKLVVGTGS